MRRRDRGEGRKAVELKIYFWNVAGLLHLCEETWEYLEKFDVIGLTETWIEDEGWKKIKGKTSIKFIWNCTSKEKE